MDTTYTATYTIDTLDEDLRKLDQTFNRTATLRQQLVDKLTPVVMDLKLHTNVEDRDGAAALDSQMNVVKTYMDLLNDEDKAIKTKVDIKAKQDEMVSNGQLIDVFISTLKESNKHRIENKKNTTSMIEEADTALESRVASEEIIISEGELREDPTDLS